jgi:hypothetical protein
LGNRQHIFSELIGPFKGQVFSEQGMLFSVTMDDVLDVPELMMYLFSLTKTLQNTQIGFERIGKYLALTFNGNKLFLIRKLRVDQGFSLESIFFLLQMIY